MAEYRLHAALLGSVRSLATAGEDSQNTAVARAAASTRPRAQRRHCHGSFFCSTDQDNNKIASFYTGAMPTPGSCRSERPLALWRSLVQRPEAMCQYAD